MINTKPELKHNIILFAFAVLLASILVVFCFDKLIDRNTTYFYYKFAYPLLFAALSLVSVNYNFRVFNGIKINPLLSVLLILLAVSVGLSPLVFVLL